MWRKPWNLRPHHKRYRRGTMATTNGKGFRSPVSTGQAKVRVSRHNHN